MTEQVVEAVADATGADPLALPPLYESIDPDALEVLCASGCDFRTTFPYAGRLVTVHADGTVEVEPGTLA